MHLSFLVNNLDQARKFYVDVLGCNEGRSAATWIDFDMHGNQLSVHFCKDWKGAQGTGIVDDKNVPMPHFGAVLPLYVWEALSKKLIDADIQFILDPQIRFKGQPGEQATMFIFDPSGNALEFKGFKEMENIFST
ncbi:MAG: glyoxalase [Glaciimonas sp.]|nr:glyoxalase [Glaciimonas sp.]